MCILFLHTDCDPGAGKYKLILAANRDEHYSRPSKEATSWGCHPDIVAGQDAEPGKEGGTWLGMSKTGKIGALLNMPPKPPNPNPNPNGVKTQKLGRGFLVTNYLKSNLNGVDYSHQLRRQNAAQIYHSFNLLTIDVNGSDKENGPTINYFSNYSPSLHQSQRAQDVDDNDNEEHQNFVNLLIQNQNLIQSQGQWQCSTHSSSNEPPHDQLNAANEHFQIELENDQIHSFGNCPYTAPFLKVKDGQLKFSQLVSTFEQREEGKLVEGLLNILKCSDKHYPDPKLETLAKARSQEFARGISSRFVHIPWKNYGSRTHTVILVDDRNHVKYMEWTMKEPIVDPLNCEWIKTKIEFDIEED